MRVLVEPRLEFVSSQAYICRLSGGCQDITLVHDTAIGAFALEWAVGGSIAVTVTLVNCAYMALVVEVDR